MKRESKAILAGALASFTAGVVALAYAAPPPHHSVDECVRQSTSCEELRACGIGPEVPCERITQEEASARGL